MDIKIKMLKTVQPDLVFIQQGSPGTVLHEGQEYAAVANKHGAISGICDNGEQMGVKPGEFKFLQAPADLLAAHGEFEKGSFLYNIVKVSNEIEDKHLTRMDFLKEIIDERVLFCPHCWADDTMYLDLTGIRPMIRCMWCDYKISLRTLAKQARSLPLDYLERAINGTHGNMPKKCQVGNDLWIANAYVAENIGDRDRRVCYPDRDTFEEFDLQGTIADYDRLNYEDAALRPQIYRSKGSYYIAELRSEHHVAYVNEDHVKNLVGIGFTFHIAGSGKPVFVKSREKLERFIMPIRFDPSSLAGDQQ